MSWWIWVLAGFLLLAIEMLSTTMHVAFFSAGAFLVAILTRLGVGGPLWAQILVFTIFSLIALFLIRPILMKKLRLNETQIVDSLVGERAVAVDAIPAAGHGKAEMRGSSWNAVNDGATELQPGQRARVERVDGLTIHIRGD
jgi:membrane protein implicated in regulation of membrane protease activity